MKKKIIITLLSLLSVFCVSTTALFAAAETYKAKQASGSVWSDVTISSSLKIGDTLDLPDRTVTVGGTEYNSTVKLYYPNGTAVAKNANYTQARLTVAGEYKLLFETRDASGAYYSAEEVFFVSDKLWKVNNAKSSISYGLGNLAEAGAEGLLVALARGDKLTFGKIIDLSAVTADTVLISGYITPTVQGSADFDSLTFTFTDVYDPEISLSVSGMRSKGSDMFAKGISYWTAWGNGQLPSGFEDLQYHHGDGYGAKFAHSWSAMRGYWSTELQTSYPCASNYNPFRIKFDTTTVKAFVGSTYITDLDDPALHDGEPVWKGFTDNKVILTVSADGVTGESANFCITSVLGYDLTADNSFYDSEAPVIALDYASGLFDENDNYKYDALVGGTYPVAGATAFDEYSGNVKVGAEVYYNYNSENERINCSIKNGVFKVNYAGKYTVVYTAKDYAGNVAKKVCSVTAVTAFANPLSITVDSEKPQAGTCGERITLPSYGVAGGSGLPSVKITATLGGTVQDVTSGVFLPEKAGEWTITYTATDVTNLPVSESFKITVTAQSEPVFVDEIILPKYLLSGMSYVVPEVYAVDYSSGEKRLVAATLRVGGNEYSAGESFTPVASSDGELLALEFKAGATTKVYNVKTLIVTSGRRLYVEKMLVGSGFTSTRAENGLTVTAAQSGTVGWTFANAVAATDSSVLIQGVSGKDGFGSLQVTFTDYADPTVAVTVNILNKKGKNAYLSFGDADRDIPQGFALSDNTFEIGYNGSKFYVGNVRVSVAKTDSGVNFNGFPSGRVYIGVKTTENTVGAEYVIKRIDNHVITTLESDRTVPRIIINGDYGGLFNPGENYVINSALVSDTVDPSASLTVTVTSPSGKLVKDVNGKELKAVPADVKYEITLSEVGQYKVYYLATDAAGNEGELSYGVNLTDRVAPTVKFGKAAKTAAVGEKVTLPAITVGDDVTPAESLTVYLTVRSADGVLTELGAASTEVSGEVYTLRYNYTFRYEGKYTFMVLVMDGAGNQTLGEYVITVQ